MKISNKAKDYIVLICICIVVIWVLSGALYFVKSLFAEELTDVEIQNRVYAEETIKNEMRFNAMWEYTENMSYEEYAETFFNKEVK